MTAPLSFSMLRKTVEECEVGDRILVADAAKFFPRAYKETAFRTIPRLPEPPPVFPWTLKDLPPFEIVEDWLFVKESSCCFTRKK